MTRLAAVAILAGLSVLPLHAQMGAGSGFVGRPSPAGSTGRGVFGRGFHSGHRGFGRTGVVYPFYPAYYDYDDYGAQPSPPPQVVVMQPAVSQQPAPAVPPPEPVLIEWQGNRFVRMTVAERNGSNSPVDYAENAKSDVVTKNPPPARELPPAILVFRDGRQQEINSYTIMNGTIFTRSDYWITGSWNQKIQIADLDVPATLRQNQQRGLNFNLPSSANEVIVRP
jgi:hypothetical protein